MDCGGSKMNKVLLWIIIIFEIVVGGAIVAFIWNIPIPFYMRWFGFSFLVVLYAFYVYVKDYWKDLDSQYRRKNYSNE
jgi:hypothetical protein